MDLEHNLFKCEIDDLTKIKLIIKMCLHNRGLVNSQWNPSVL